MRTEERLRAELGFKKLSPTWAKAEIFLGLLAAAVGVLSIAGPQRLWGVPDEARDALGLVLLVLGPYLAMAGHRSHLYQSQTRLAAWLADEVARRTPPGA